MPNVSDRERVLRLLQKNEGLSNRQIKNELRLSDERYGVVRRGLLDSGLVAKYVCQGGGIRLASGASAQGHTQEAIDRLVHEATQRYVDQRDKYKKLADYVHEKCKELVKNDAVRATTQARTKDPDRFAAKVRRYLSAPSVAAELDSVERIMARVGDLAGVRVATYVEEDREKVVKAIEANFSGPVPGKPVHVEKKDGKGKSEFYRATHCQVTIKGDELKGIDVNLRGVPCEVQVCSLLAHVFNEIEHDLGYKPLSGEISQEEGGFLSVLGRLSAMGDHVIVNLLSAVANRKKDREIPFNDAFELVYKMRDKFDNPRTFWRHSGQLFDELKNLGLDSEADIGHKLLGGGTGYKAHSRVLLDKFKRYLKRQNSEFGLDPDSSDCLLVLVLEKYAGRVVANHAGRVGAAPRILSMARAFSEMK